jgi:hypothetical protein
VSYKYSDRTVFILGMPRSGTTWLAKVLDGHPGVVYRHEPDIVRRIGDIPSRCPIAEAAPYVPRAQAWLNELAEMGCLKTAGPSPMFPKSYRSRIESGVRLACLGLFKAAGQLPYLAASAPSFPVPDFVDLNSDACLRIVISSVSSMGRSGLLALAAPETRFILVMRHPWGQIESVLRGVDKGMNTNVDRTIADAESARRRNLTVEKLRSLPLVARLAWQWVIANETVMEELSGAAHFQAVRMFELNHEPMRLMPPLLDFCGVPWNEQSSRFISWSTQGTGSEGYYNMQRNPAEATWGWRRRLSQSQIDAISEVVSDSAIGRMFDPEPPSEPIG